MPLEWLLACRRIEADLDLAGHLFVNASDVCTAKHWVLEADSSRASRVLRPTHGRKVVVVARVEQQHQMVRQAVHDDGVQDWLCPECGRRLLLTWPPNYRKVVLHRGDVWAAHVGATGGLRLSNVKVPPQAKHTWTEEDEQALRTWASAEGDEPLS